MTKDVQTVLKKLICLNVKKDFTGASSTKFKQSGTLFKNNNPPKY